MKISPIQLIGASSILALIVSLLYFYQTSPDVTDIPPEQVTGEVLESSPESGLGKPPLTQEAEASLETAMGITLARVRPDGMAVIVGNAPDGSTVNLYIKGELIGTTLVASGNGQGEWVIIPEKPLTPGAYLLTLEIIAPDGTQTIGAMALAVEIPQNGEDKPLVALVPYTGDAVAEAKILQAPATLEGTETGANIAEDAANAALSPRLTIQSIQALSPDTMSITGKAEGGITVILGVNNVQGRAVTPDETSIYATHLPIDSNADRFNLHGVLKNAAGEDVATASITLSRSQVEQSAGNNALIVVQKGDALWRIAYKTYGQGIRYLDIYHQNQLSIDNPDLIYPDQVFIIPNG